MAGINVGSVGVTVYPDTGQFWSRFKAETQPGADKAGRDLGDELSNGIPRKLAEAVNEGLNGNDAGHKGSDAGKAFADDFSRQVFTRIEAALKSLPTSIRVDADTAPALAQLEGVRAALIGERDNIGVGVSVDSAGLARIAALRAELEFLSHDNINTSGSVASLGRLAAQSEATAAAERVLLNDTDRLTRAFDGAGFAGGGFLQILLKLAIFLGPALIPVIAAGTGALLGMGLAAGGAALAFYGFYTQSNKAASDNLIARWQRLQQILADMSAPAAGAFMDKFAAGFDAVNRQLPSFTSMFSRFAADAGTVAGNVGLGLLSLLTALEPMASRIGLDFVRWSNSLATIGSSSTFSSFMAYAAKEGPVVADVLRDLATIALRVVQAFEPWGNVIIAALSVFAATLKAIPLPVLQTMALLFEGFMAYKLLGAVFDGIALGILNMGLAAESANMGAFASKLTNVAAGAEKFAAVGGLISPVTAGITVALLAGLFVWQRHEQQVQAAKAAVQQYTTALQQSNGVIDESIVKMAAERLQQAGALDAAKKLGVSYGDATQAVIGNASAHDQLVNTLKANIAAYKDGAAVTAYSSQADLQSADAKRRVAEQSQILLDAINRESGELKTAAGSQDQINQAQASSLAVTAKLSDSYDKLGHTLGINVDAVKKYAQDLGLADDSNGKFADSVQGLAQSYAKANTAQTVLLDATIAYGKSAGSAADQAKYLGSVLVSSQGDTLGVASAFAAAYGSARDFTEQVKSDSKLHDGLVQMANKLEGVNLATADLSTYSDIFSNAAAPAVTQALGGIQQSGQAAAEAWYQHQVGIEGAQTAADEAGQVFRTTTHDALFKLLGDLGLNKEQAGALADNLFKMDDKTFKSDLFIEGLSSATEAIHQLALQLANLNGTKYTSYYSMVIDYTVGQQAFVDQRNAAFAGTPFGAYNGGIVKAYAKGGFNNALAQIVPDGTNILFAEQGTGGEAFIPMGQSHRGRSTQILDAVASDFGFALQPKGGDGASAGGTAAIVGQLAAMNSQISVLSRQIGREVGRQVGAGGSRRSPG